VSVGGPVWRTNLADLGGGVGLWRFGIEPGLIGTLRCEDRQVTDRVRRSPAVGALWLALFDWRSNLAVSVDGVSWRCLSAVSVGGVCRRCLLAVSVGGPTWRTSLAVSPPAVQVRAAH
jgi:hypothetical protein